MTILEICPNWGVNAIVGAFVIVQKQNLFSFRSQSPISSFFLHIPYQRTPHDHRSAGSVKHFQD